LDDISGADGGCDSAVTVACAWKKFHDKLPILTRKRLQTCL